MTVLPRIPLDTGTRWLLMFHQLPAKPAYLRVKVWRRLQATGAIAIKNAVYALPVTEQAQEDFEWVRKEIEQAGGEAVICEARLLDGLTDAGIRGLFNTTRDAEYGEIADQLRNLSGRVKTPGESLPELRALFGRLKSRHAQNVAIDFFGASGREVSDGLIGALEGDLASDQGRPAGTSPAESSKLQMTGRVWVTRQGVHVDRIACAWMIRRFIDPAATIKFVLPREYQHTPGELRFDMFDGELTHEGDCCSFEVLMARAGLDDPALVAIAEIVHDIDLKEDKFGREETAGVKALVNGICGGTHDDEERIARGAAILNDLYAGFQRRTPRQKERRRPPRAG